MAITVTSDLTDVTSADTLTTNGQFYRLNGVNSGNPAQELDSYVQGGATPACVAYKTGTTVGTTDTGGHFNSTATFDATNKHLFLWAMVVTAGNMPAKASDGFDIGLTNTSTTSTTAWSTTNYKRWRMDGSDTTPASVGWKCYVIDPSGTADLSAGTLTLTTLKNVGILLRQTTSVGTGLNNIFNDAIRIGTGMTAVASSAADTITFSTLYARDKTLANAWGILTQTAGIYYGAGKMTVGSTTQTNTCAFTDTNQVLVWRNYPVSTTLYELLLKGASGFKTTMTLTGCVIRGQSAQVWNVTCNDAYSDFKLYNSTIADCRAMTLSAGSVLSSSSFSNCGTITAGGATITKCTFGTQTATQMSFSAPSQVNNVTGCTFTSPGTGHAMVITGTAADFTVNNVFTGYASSNGSTGNEAIYVNIATGNVQISYTGGGSNPSIRTAGATVTFASTPVTVKVTVKDASTGAVIPNARVYLTRVSDSAVVLPNTSLTDSNGVVTTSYSYTANADVTGVARRATSGYGTLYKPNVISGTITSSGFDQTVLLTSDE